MPRPSLSIAQVYVSCRHTATHHNVQLAQLSVAWRCFATSSRLRSQVGAAKDDGPPETQIAASASRETSSSNTEDASIIQPGAMSRRLADATEDALLTGGRAGRTAIKDAGFSDDLRDRLLEKVAAAQFRSDNASAFAEASLSSSKVGEGSRHIAAAPAWTGTETTEDTVLRMLNDAHKPLSVGLRGKPRVTMSNPVDMRIKAKSKSSSGERLLNARDKASIYAITADANASMSEQEKESFRKEMKERFRPGGGAGASPNSFRGLAALANERIEDAIARGQFANIPRGKAIVRDARADNPFIDTTEYIMNKMIQRQDIVPPWIEKQQELVKTAANFRARLRQEWMRHVARTIASRGGGVAEHVETARLYAESEAVSNPRAKRVESLSVPSTITGDAVMVNVSQNGAEIGTEGQTEDVHVTLLTKHGEVEVSAETAAEVAGAPGASEVPLVTTTLQSDPEPQDTSAEIIASTATQPTTTSFTSPPQQQQRSLPPPFRDPTWLATEHSYLTLCITNLNTLARSYNLMAPDLAKKPYYSLERELLSCYADVAPQVAEEILERARKPPARALGEVVEHKAGGVMERFAMDKAAFVADDRRRPYGMREFWRDLWDGARNLRG